MPLGGGCGTTCSRQPEVPSLRTDRTHAGRSRSEWCPPIPRVRGPGRRPWKAPRGGCDRRGPNRLHPVLSKGKVQGLSESWSSSRDHRQGIPISVTWHSPSPARFRDRRELNAQRALVNSWEEPVRMWLDGSLARRGALPALADLTPQRMRVQGRQTCPPVRPTESHPWQAMARPP